MDRMRSAKSAQRVATWREVKAPTLTDNRHVMAMGMSVLCARRLYPQGNAPDHRLRQWSLALAEIAKGKRCRPVCTVVQQEEMESIPASSYECTMVHCVFRGALQRALRHLRKGVGMDSVLLDHLGGHAGEGLGGHWASGEKQMNQDEKCQLGQKAAAKNSHENQYRLVHSAAIKRQIYSLYKADFIPSVKDIRDALDKSWLFSGSKWSVWELQKLNFRYAKNNFGRKLQLEKPDIIAKRFHFLRRMRDLRITAAAKSAQRVATWREVKAPTLTDNRHVMAMGMSVLCARRLYPQGNAPDHRLRQWSLALAEIAKGKRCRPVCTVVQQEEMESIPASSYECTMVHCVFRG
ncbi:hypothetical protein ANN_00874 [Periplaneta americana]|uniref:Uncharacterized protein n=1 Tax=Periplaneta americana TaxID=6978 RepID=A0ABQ8TW17_PERAM|nr:hypothetical protein ANN_00874 [Periplaneta americana]